MGAAPAQPKPWRQLCKTQDLHSLPSLCLLDSSFTLNKGPVALGAREELTKDHSFSAALRQTPHLIVQDGTRGLDLFGGLSIAARRQESVTLWDHTPGFTREDQQSWEGNQGLAAVLNTVQTHLLGWSGTSS